METEVILKLSDMMVGQIVDGLNERMKAWRYTQRYLETGLIEESYPIEECSSAHEAERIADYYEEIIGSINKQIAK